MLDNGVGVGYSSPMNEITYTVDACYDYGVWVKGKPAGRIRIKDGQFRAFTNKRAPGEPGSFRGTFADRDSAGEAVAEAHRTLR